MKVFVVLKNETDYNGDVSVLGVYKTYDDAKVASDWEIEKATDWYESMLSIGEHCSPCIPEMTITEAECED